MDAEFKRALKTICDEYNRGTMGKEEFEKQIVFAVLCWYRELPR